MPTFFGSWVLIFFFIASFNSTFLYFASKTLFTLVVAPCKGPDLKTHLFKYLRKVIWFNWYFHFAIWSHRLVLDDTVHLSDTPPSFGTRGSLILDIVIASYFTTIFFNSFLYFILQVKPRQETNQGVPPPHQTADNVINENPSRLASSHTQKGGYGKLLAIGTMEANTGIFHPFLFRPLGSDKDATHLLPTYPPWRRPPAHSAVTAEPLDPAPTGACHQDADHLGRPGLWTGAGHPGGITWKILCDGTHRDEDIHNSVLSGPARIKGDLLNGTPDQRWGSSWRCRNRNGGESRRVGDRFHMLPQDECG